MKKLLILALLGLVLGAGIWKSQNPEGGLDDARLQAGNVIDRLKAGALTVRDTPTTSQTDSDQSLSALETRLAQIEESLVQRIPDTDTEAAPEPLPEPVSVSEPDAAQSDGTNSDNNELATSVQDALANAEANVVRINAIDSRLELLVRRLDEQGVEVRLGEVKNLVNSFGEMVTEQRRNNAILEIALGNKVEDATEQAEAIGLRLDTLAAGNATAAEGSSDAAQSNAAVNALSSTLDQRLKLLESRLSTANSDARKIDALNGQLDEAKTLITQLQQENAATQRRLTQVNGSLAKLETAGESVSIETVQAEIRDQLALLQSQFETSVVSDNAAALQELLNTTRTRVDELEARVESLPATSTEASNAQDFQTALESQVLALERRLQDISNTNPEIATSLSGAAQDADQPNSRGYVTQEDLRTGKEQAAVQYKIYFDRNSVDITDAAATVLDSFIAQEKNRTTGVSIFGFTDRLGSVTYNQQLALQRATNVRSYLVKNGFDYTKIKALSGLGEDAATAVLPDDAGDAQQRIVVLFAAQP
ncbi:OmpA family protein [Granulosicoccus antarcticus]|uniref:OmpA-like domain-containing protein n=1 Tax=Granulosicoccus antarcticus IMCC3135 TaxID=1192854 RepID=A0A2Z2NUT2_9GAMM|nr:OmpA family protein [Granulosicoccus antarcticus]ASJ72530.1 hypothetical protein IMCC3135_12210 [Granulosicoccus antarcticus IMCC3135]